MCGCMVYKTLIISTIVDEPTTPYRSTVYKTFVISTIVDIRQCLMYE